MSKSRSIAEHNEINFKILFRLILIFIQTVTNELFILPSSQESEGYNTIISGT